MDGYEGLSKGALWITDLESWQMYNGTPGDDVIV